MHRQDADRWVGSLFAAWRTADPDAAAALFTEEAEYRSHPFRAPMSGRTAIAEYWRRATETQDRLDLHVGTPLVDGDRVAVEWWVSMEDDGEESVSTGSLFLTFDGELCRSLRETWIETDGRLDPYDGWGR